MYGTGEQVAIFARNCRRHAHFDAMRATDLLTFHRDRHRAAQDNQVIEHPDDTDPNGQDLIFRAIEVTPDPSRHAHQVQQHQIDIGTGNDPVDIFVLHQSSFRRHVELTFMRVNQRDKGRRRDIPGQRGFVDFAPERVAIFALNLRVRQARMNHMRQDEERDHQRRRIDDIGVQQ